MGFMYLSETASLVMMEAAKVGKSSIDKKEKEINAQRLQTN
jgi:hypothetical protein